MVEKQAKEVSVEERLPLRQAHSVPVLADLRQKLLAWKEQLLPKHPMAEAVKYTLSPWAELQGLFSHGLKPIATQFSQRQIETRVLAPKHAVFRRDLRVAS